MRLRLLISATFSYLALITAPKELRSIQAAFPNLLKGLRDELSIGRDGGVAIIPWSISQRGKDLSKVQHYACLEAADGVRASWAKHRQAAA
ncbi:hypothetical protein [Mesorhizobium sp. M8A.F.Ca.ET.021.01.1.1]|uniref:hypothetical protein n=1 Tax=Mesorhizobium sp. M8A.F.Ca.ET.021.01.1.1 TaxID=2496757 RepID=UPI000FCA43CE|nr:hypothetical protein [Mesorhizobium sp. M8A.F.Ca.ET.021.01.1.1]RUW57146.1 hypothetical protein EOA36_00755 [Mesorhizobium sp. M8A.F.Ca.ET.021.01.1.1]